MGTCCGRQGVRLQQCQCASVSMRRYLEASHRGAAPTIRCSDPGEVQGLSTKQVPVAKLAEMVAHIPDAPAPFIPEAAAKPMWT